MILSTTACISLQANSKRIKDPDFILLDASFEKNVPGYIHATKTTEYYFKIVINTKKQLKFDSLWIDSCRFKIFISKSNGTIKNSLPIPKYRDTIFLRVTAGIEKALAAFPITHEGKALIGYQVDKTKKYFTINDIQLQTGPLRQ